MLGVWKWKRWHKKKAFCSLLLVSAWGYIKLYHTLTSPAPSGVLYMGSFGTGFDEKRRMRAIKRYIRFFCINNVLVRHITLSTQSHLIHSPSVWRLVPWMLSFYIPYSPVSLGLVWFHKCDQFWVDFCTVVFMSERSQTRQSFVPQYEEWQRSTFILLSQQTAVKLFDLSTKARKSVNFYFAVLIWVHFFGEYRCYL